MITRLDRVVTVGASSGEADKRPRDRDVGEPELLTVEDVDGRGCNLSVVFPVGLAAGSLRLVADTGLSGLSRREEAGLAAAARMVSSRAEIKPIRFSCKRYGRIRRLAGSTSPKCRCSDG